MRADSQAAVDHPPAIASVRGKWIWILVLGIALLLCGLMAVTLPNLTSTTVSAALGGALVVIGVVKVVEAFKVKDWGSFQLRVVPGVVEIAGGFMIYANPVKWAIAISLLAAIVLAIQGIAQLGLAFRARPRPGWGWVLASGVVALCASLALIMKFPVVRAYEPSTIAGLSLFIIGGHMSPSHS
jgi:uncharacterized membrane protein HdeD (DUF308 family)